ncbi:MAG: protein-glutamate O-methyltransferase CheR [Deltaproteobacteria bacterium]|nr:protein-glutamate O-methyltransferase CheR [Deltaproteobacteria bacterium]
MLLEKIYSERGWDFRNYKRASLKRRIQKRFAALNAGSCKDYCRSLDTDPAEYDRLFSTLTIKVSEFFREPEVFDFLSRTVAERFKRDEGIKAWCCGCAFGEEAYSLAIVLSECLSAEGLKNSRVFATDIDSDALDTARKAVYRGESLRNVTQEVQENYFFKVDGMHKVKYNIRNLVKFGTQDIVKSPSISKVQVLFCRNLFIYFNKFLQEKVFEKLDYSLVPGGLLVLGKAEVLPPRFASGYTPLGERLSVYEKKA